MISRNRVFVWTIIWIFDYPRISDIKLNIFDVKIVHKLFSNNIYTCLFDVENFFMCLLIGVNELLELFESIFELVFNTLDMQGIETLRVEFFVEIDYLLDDRNVVGYLTDELQWKGVFDDSLPVVTQQHLREDVHELVSPVLVSAAFVPQLELVPQVDVELLV